MSMKKMKRRTTSGGSRPAGGSRGRVRLGSHVSIAGGIDRAVLTARDVGCEALQIFVKSSNQWRAAPFREGEVERFRSNLETTGLGPVVAHDSYLINLCSPDDALWEKSVGAFELELDRCEALGIPFLVTHPGSHLGSGEEAGLARLARAIDRVHSRRPEGKVKILLETTAGQGSGLGHRFEHLSAVLRKVDNPSRVGVCLDTCHIFAAGYDIRTPRGYRETLERFESEIGLGKLMAIHLNDSKRELGSRVDRHQQIGKGHLGVEAFRFLVNDPRLVEVPMVLETPKGPDYAEDRVNLALLRSLIR
jgi:deoxyribonuclease-4